LGERELKIKPFRPWDARRERRVLRLIWLALQKVVAANRSMRELPHTHSCFVCGESNPLGLKLRFETDGQVVQAQFTLRPEHVGFRGTIHGGITATILDEIMVWACAVQTQRFAVCAELNVRYLSPVRPGDAVVATGELAVNRRNKLFEARANLRLKANAETVLASAAGKYLPIKEAEAAELARDFVGEPLMRFDGAD
jgi:uncharacterized protein (TIGR00369 family)